MPTHLFSNLLLLLLLRERESPHAGQEILLSALTPFIRSSPKMYLNVFSFQGPF